VSWQCAQPGTFRESKTTDLEPTARGASISIVNTTELLMTQQTPEDAEEGNRSPRLVKIIGTAMLDNLREQFKSSKVVVARNPDTGRFISQMLSLKRQQTMVRDEFTWTWVKTDGVDHAHFSMCYLLTACLLRGTAGAWTTGAGISLVSSFRMKG